VSILAVVKIYGDTGAFRQSLVDRAGDYKKIGEMARAAGAVHHRFGIGDGFVLGIDEWETAEQFQQFFSNPELHEFIGSVGGAPTPPEITITEAVASPDEF